ncbi:hypothetical protein ACS5PN_11605 [Roseateles sp. NT4]|uniref:hypothetical protein n=1 Tax=Roseateles sp. NT4 TaxID=3453715 RepID=UPI003EE832E5
MPGAAEAYANLFQTVPAVYLRVVVEERPPTQFRIGDVGTGGLASETFFRLRHGYKPFPLEERVEEPSAGPWADRMAEVKQGFGRTMSRLPEVFGVSRQTLYNWLAGETPKEVHQQRLRQLAAAAAVFTEQGFKPTAVMLDKTVSAGKSLLALLRDGADGAEVAQKLIRLEKRTAESRGKLDMLLAGHSARPQVGDMGTPAFSEDV